MFLSNVIRIYVLIQAFHLFGGDFGVRGDFSLKVRLFPKLPLRRLPADIR